MISLPGILGALVVGLTVGLLIADVRALVLRGCRRLMRRAAKSLPKRHRRRYEEEWLANLTPIADAPLSMLTLTLYTVIRASFWARELSEKASDSEERQDSVTKDSIEAARPLRVSFPRRSLGNSTLTFDQFVVGDSNRLAHEAALVVAQMPGQAYNPLFISGPTGVGKTHLISAIANLLIAHDPALAVRVTTGEAFTNEFLGALGSGSKESFQSRFRDVDVLLVDDVQFLERKTRTEEEFFHTFNALHEAGRQVVLTSDRPAHDLHALEDRLRDRFEAGLGVDMSAPDLPTRLAILRSRAQHDGVELVDDEALEVIAAHIQRNVRVLKGALIRVAAFGSLTGRPVTADIAREVVRGLYPAPAGTQTCTVGGIQEVICARFALSQEELISTNRSPRVAWPRQLAMHLSREITDASLLAIGREFGGRSDKTVLYACRRAKARIDSDPEASLEAWDVRRRLRSSER